MLEGILIIGGDDWTTFQHEMELISSNRKVMQSSPLPWIVPNLQSYEFDVEIIGDSSILLTNKKKRRSWIYDKSSNTL